jgi:hypothetical protein
MLYGKEGLVWRRGEKAFRVFFVCACACARRGRGLGEPGSILLDENVTCVAGERVRLWQTD